MIQVLRTDNPKEITQIMREVAVDPYGIKIMLPKAITHLVRMNSLSYISANILKQEMLSLGGDVALSRKALTGGGGKTDCLLMGNLSQFNRLGEKLTLQPFGLSRMAADLSSAIENYGKRVFRLDLGRYSLKLGGARSSLMAILNLTPDSFSGDGLKGWDLNYILDIAMRMVEEGADIIDVGGESTRPGAKAVSAKEELKRVIPAIKVLAKKLNVPISVDTYKPEVAKASLDNGACMINDICGLRDARIPKIAARYKAGIVIMHMQGKPRTMQKNPKYKSLISDITEYLGAAVKQAKECGIRADRIIIDPGIGFGKSVADNLQILRRLSEFRLLGQPILVGTSRKSFIGKILNAAVEERISGSVASSLLAVENGAHIVRVHDVKEVKQALKILDAVRGSEPCIS
ncbi:MAG TPA: dihydropteroate synthase [Candidatus Margulisiibacteriota bacterium]|nr:dihydropteroate synthase [Candidatus Margulisiibacteriota bacterium]